jgi:hypothetical protein
MQSSLYVFGGGLLEILVEGLIRSRGSLNMRLLWLGVYQFLVFAICLLPVDTIWKPHCVFSLSK